jgi:hypothetical protein
MSNSTNLRPTEGLLDEDLPPLPPIAEIPSESLPESPLMAQISLTVPPPAHESKTEMATGPEMFPAASLLSTLQSLHQEQMEGFRKELLRIGPRRWKNSRLTSVASLNSLADDLLAETLLTETKSFWLSSNARIRECADCPRGGARCAGGDSGVPEGEQVEVYLDAESRAFRRVTACDKYREYRVTRRLESLGVDRSLATVRFDQYRQRTRVEVVHALADFSASPESQQILLTGDRAREYGVFFFMSFDRARPNASSRSVHVPTLIRELKDAMTERRRATPTELLDLDLLLLDGLDYPDLKASGHFTKELSYLISRRVENLAPTLITTTKPIPKEAFPGMRVLAV